MNRSFAVVLLAGLLLGSSAGTAFAQDGGETPPTTTKAPLRPFDPPLPEAVFIPDLVSDLVVTDLGGSLDVSSLTANPPAVTPGSGFSIDWAAWAEFASPAAIPMLMALGLVALTRVPRRPADRAAADGNT